MSHPNPSTALARVLVDELARNGVTRAVISPGSRSTALAIALSEHDEIDSTVSIDERSAGFRALGFAASSGSPAVVVTTSGSAVANLFPAVVEADRSGVPMLCLTADRPPEMVARRTNQTMDQVSGFSAYVRALHLLGPAVDEPAANSKWREAVVDAVAASLGAAGSPGPVQINIAFEEPTVPVSDDGRRMAEPFLSTTEGGPGGAPWVSGVAVGPATGGSPDVGKRTILIAGRGDYDGGRLRAVAAEKGIPVLATALSGARGDDTIGTYHHILVEGVPAHLAPDAVIVAGQPGPSDRLVALMDGGIPVTHIDRWGLFSDVSGTMTSGLRADPVAALVSVSVDQAEGWSDEWLECDRAMRRALDHAVAAVGFPSGPGVAHAIDGASWQALVVASSLPVRDVDAMLTGGWVHCNRGVSGIDGFVSTALGVADDRSGVVAMSGDLSLLHDSNGFLSDRIPPVVFVVVDNDGGGLFDLLPQAQHAPDFERLFIAPPDRDLEVLSRFHGIGFDQVDAMADLGPRVDSAVEAGERLIIRVPVDRRADLAVRSELDDAARSALGV